MLSVPLIIVLLLALLYVRFADHPGVAGALRGMSAVTAGMIFASALKLIPALNRHPFGKRQALLLSLGCFVCIALFKLPLLYVLLLLGGASWCATHRKLP